MKKSVIICFFVIVLVVLFLRFAIAQEILFETPTPANPTITANTSVVINVSVANVTLSEFKLNWAGTNYTFYDNRTIAVYNLDNSALLGESGTKVVDASRFGKNGTPSSATWTSAGKYSGAYNFSGSGQDITTGALQTYWKDATFCGWVKETTGTSYGAMFSQGDSTHGWLTVQVYAGTETMGVRDSTAHSQLYALSNYPLNDTKWHHLCGTWNNAAHNVSLYIDGSLSANANDTVTDLTNIAFGNFGGIGMYYVDGGTDHWDDYKGLIDEVRVYNYTMTLAEVKQQYYSNLNKYNLSLWYFYSNQSGLSIGDYNYQTYAKDTNGNENQTEFRKLTVTYPSCVPPNINNDWTANWKDNCTLSSNINLGTGDLILNGTEAGTFTLNANLTVERSVLNPASGAKFVQLPGTRLMYVK